MDMKQSFEGVPLLKLEEFFNGRLKGHGIVTGFGGAVKRYVHVSAEGLWNEKERQLSLKETYSFDDGSKDELDWTIWPLEGGRYTGHEPRLNGKAEGTSCANIVNWRYTRSMTDGNSSAGYVFFNDVFKLMDETSLIATASLSKWGFPLGQMVVFYRKIRPDAGASTLI